MDDPQRGVLRERNIELLRAHIELTAGPIRRYDARYALLQDVTVQPASGEYAPTNETLRTLHGPLAGALGRYSIYDGGVYDNAGHIVPSAIHLGGGRRHLPGIDPPQAPVEHLDGLWLWGGVLQPHFGHFLTESLGRLWAWPRVRARMQGIVWLLPGEVPPHKVDAYSAIPQRAYMAQLFDLLGIETTHRVVTGQFSIQRLIVPNQLMANLGGRAIAGHAAFRDFTRRVAKTAPPAPKAHGSRIYVSRAGMETGGRFVMEAEMEACFAAAGWSILRPETLDMRAQIAAYTAAEQLIFAEGSALHLFAFVAKPDQRVAIICRRTPAKRKFEMQLHAYGLEDVHTIDTVAAALLPTRSGGEGAPTPIYRNDMDVLLDIGALEGTLAEAGFVAPGTFSTLTPERLEAAAEAACLARTAAQPHLPYAVISRDALAALPRGPNIREERLAEKRAMQAAG